MGLMQTIANPRETCSANPRESDQRTILCPLHDILERVKCMGGLGERAHGPGARALEVARVLHQRVGGDVVLSLHPGVRARPRRKEPRQ